MALKSQLFTQPTNQKLNDCARFDRNHIFEGANNQGDHVGRIQTALTRLRDSDPSLELPAIGVEELGNQRYGQRTAAAVLQYKKKRGIIRPGQRLDNIVGIQTIAKLDEEMFSLQNRPSIPNLPIPPIDPTPVPPSVTRRLTRRQFVKTDSIAGQGASPSDDTGKEITSALLDFALGALSAEATLAPFESAGSRRIASFPSRHRVNRATFAVDVNNRIESGGSITITTTTMSYEWGEPLPMVNIVRTHIVTTPFKELEIPPVTTSEFLPRQRAENTPFVVPPNP